MLQNGLPSDIQHALGSILCQGQEVLSLAPCEDEHLDLLLTEVVDKDALESVRPVPDNGTVDKVVYTGYEVLPQGNGDNPSAHVSHLGM